ncbi:MULTISPECIES: hypothetical protein [unclassified Microbacterium]|uniref:hypothetical protein n=1 Tax=unclassified Microbacterium TaxID=2609290 RepID=UPI00386DD8F9
MTEFAPVPVDRVPNTGPVDILPSPDQLSALSVVTGALLIIDLALVAVLIGAVSR